jgi:hypothetical protein
LRKAKLAAAMLASAITICMSRIIGFIIHDAAQEVVE